MTRYISVLIVIAVLTSCRTYEGRHDVKAGGKSHKQSSQRFIEANLPTQDKLILFEQYDPQNPRQWIDFHPCQDPPTANAAQYAGCPMKSGLRELTQSVINQMKKTRWGRSSRGGKVLDCFQDMLQPRQKSDGFVAFHYRCQEPDALSGKTIPRGGLRFGDAQYLAPNEASVGSPPEINVGVPQNKVGFQRDIPMASFLLSVGLG